MCHLFVDLLAFELEKPTSLYNDDFESANKISSMVTDRSSIYWLAFCGQRISFDLLNTLDGWMSSRNAGGSCVSSTVFPGPKGSFVSLKRTTSATFMSVQSPYNSYHLLYHNLH